MFLLRPNQNSLVWLHRRCYATLNKILSHHERHELGPWPKSKSPTPQEIFALLNKEFGLSHLEFQKILKPKYNKYLKIYHPDIINKHEIYNEKGVLMTPEMKRSRFDTIQKAYEVLKDPKKRLAYGRSVTTDFSQYSKDGDSFENFRRANAHRKQYDYKNDEQFWQAGTWEDYYNMKFNRSPPTKEEFDKNKYKILAGVIVVMCITTTIQLLLAFDSANDLKLKVQLQNLQLMKEHERVAFDNYNNKFSSVRDLLVKRRSTFNDETSIKEQEALDAEVLTDYAKQQVQRYH